MQVIENWADIQGSIRSLNEPGDVAGFVTALIDSVLGDARPAQ